MDLWIWIARSVVAAVLGAIIFVSFLSYILVSHFANTLLDSSFYTQVLNEHDTYNWVYDELLLDTQVRDVTRQLTDDFQIVTHEEIVQLARDIAPPEYLQDQMEENIQRTTEYMNGDVDELELYIEMGPPLSRFKPALFAKLDQRIDGLQTVEPDPNRSLLEQVEQARRLTESSVRSLGSGVMPSSVPSLMLFPEPIRDDLFDVLLPNILRDQRLDPRVRNSLEVNSTELKNEFVSGDTHRFLKVTARAIVDPILNEALARIKQSLDSQDRLDIIAAAAGGNDQQSEADIRADLAQLRDLISRVQRWGKSIALAVGVSATVAMVLIYLPSLTDALRWPGLTLLLSGAVIFVLAKVLENTLAERLNDVIDIGIARSSQLPPSLSDFATDVSHTLVQRSVEGIASPALVLLVLGALLFGGSFLVSMVRPDVAGRR